MLFNHTATTVLDEMAGWQREAVVRCTSAVHPIAQSWAAITFLSRNGTLQTLEVAVTVIDGPWLPGLVMLVNQVVQCGVLVEESIRFKEFYEIRLRRSHGWHDPVVQFDHKMINILQCADARQTLDGFNFGSLDVHLEHNVITMLWLDRSHEPSSNVVRQHGDSAVSCNSAIVVSCEVGAQDRVLRPCCHIEHLRERLDMGQRPVQATQNGCNVIKIDFKHIDGWIERVVLGYEVAPTVERQGVPIVSTQIHKNSLASSLGCVNVLFCRSSSNERRVRVDDKLW
mmetsp:Transcript_48451/g.101222  ORF Transcript_48451/g.101222 Transcript_48451/m.101222 type:complete len:284 (-) Transcript_48451:87-938(-)